MGKVGRFVIDPRAGAYCQVSLDSGERILVSHDKGGFAAGAVTIQEVRWWGLASGQTLLTCDLGREEGGEKWGPRPIDIDILLFGSRTLRTASLVVPHPRMWERHFVLRPLADLAPDLSTPEGVPISRLLGSSEIAEQGLKPHIRDTNTD